MARSIQVYQFNTSKSAPRVEEICKEKMKKQNKSNYPQFLKVEKKGSYVIGRLKISRNLDILTFDFTLKPSNNMLIVQGPSIGRIDVNSFLADVIENGTRYDVVTEYSLEVKDMLKIFKNITNESDRNIITILRAFFEPQRGLDYARETYTELAYKFVENRCASKHADFKIFCNNAKKMYLVIGLVYCTGVIPDNQLTHSRLDVNPNCSFRMYVDKEPEEWNAFCFKILDFL